MIDTALIISDPEIMGGTPVFQGTRVPVKYLLDWLGGGYTLAEFLDNYPSVTQEQAEAVIKLANEWLASQATPAA